MREGSRTGGYEAATRLTAARSALARAPRQPPARCFNRPVQTREPAAHTPVTLPLHRSCVTRLSLAPYQTPSQPRRHIRHVERGDDELHRTLKGVWVSQYGVDLGCKGQPRGEMDEVLNVAHPFVRNGHEGITRSLPSRRPAPPLTPRSPGPADRATGGARPRSTVGTPTDSPRSLRGRAYLAWPNPSP